MSLIEQFESSMLKLLKEMPYFTEADVDRFRTELMAALDRRVISDDFLQHFEDRARRIHTFRAAQEDPELVTYELMNNFHLLFMDIPEISKPEYVLEAIQEAVAATGIDYTSALAEYTTAAQAPRNTKDEMDLYFKRCSEARDELFGILIVAFRWIRRNRPDITWSELTS